MEVLVIYRTAVRRGSGKGYFVFSKPKYKILNCCTYDEALQAIKCCEKDYVFAIDSSYKITPHVLP